jgi:hypothetical protein
MVRGIATDKKKYKHKDRNDTKWLAKDLNEFRHQAEEYIDSKRPKDEKDFNYTIEKSKKKTMPFVRTILIILGIMGFFALIYGIYSLIQEVNILNIINTLIGAIFLGSLILFEKYG